MKMKNIVATLLCVFVSQQALSLGVTVYNKSSDKEVQIDPVWSGTQRGWIKLAPNGGHEYRTGLHHLKGLLFKGSSGICYLFNFDPVILEAQTGKKFPTLRGTGDIQIAVIEGKFTNPDGSKVDGAVASVMGHTDMVRKAGTRVDYKAKASWYSCDKVDLVK